jgi:DNA polymerase III alpha subunit
MNTDKYGQVILNENDLVDLFLTNPERSFNYAFVETDLTISDDLEIDQPPTLIKYVENNHQGIAEFDHKNQAEWLMPDSYKNLDIAKWVLDRCSNDEELQRVGMELIEFQRRDMFDLLRYLKYLVDTMRKNQIVWGVGRGSSVSSFVLYLIGVHRINSLYYNLSIDEFLK